MLLVHQAHGGIAQGQEAVILLVQGVAVARERGDKQLQLVVGVLADMDTHAPESVLQIVGAFLYVRVGRHSDNKVEMAVHEHLALPCNNLLHTLDVFHGHLVAGIGDARVAVLLLVECRQFPLLVGQEDDLVIHHRLGFRYAVDDGQQVNGHLGVVHLDVGVGPYKRRQRHAVHIHEAVHLATLAAHRDRLVVHLEIGHGHDPVPEVHGEVAVNKLFRLRFAQKFRLYARIVQQVMHLTYLHEEVAPLLAVEREQAAFPGFLRDGQVAGAVRVSPSIEVTEIGIGQELVTLVCPVLEPLADKNVLLVYGISFAQGLSDGGEQACELVVAVDVRRILLHGILHPQDGGVFAGLGVQHPNAVHILHGEIDVLEDALALSARAEGIDRDGHARTQGCECQYDVQCHCRLLPVK